MIVIKKLFDREGNIYQVGEGGFGKTSKIKEIRDITYADDIISPSPYFLFIFEDGSRIYMYANSNIFYELKDS